MKDKQIGIKMSEYEIELCKKRSAQKGLNVSQYIRSLVREDSSFMIQKKTTLYKVPVGHDEFVEIYTIGDQMYMLTEEGKEKHLGEYTIQKGDEMISTLKRLIEVKNKTLWKGIDL